MASAEQLFRDLEKAENLLSSFQNAVKKQGRGALHARWGRFFWFGSYREWERYRVSEKLSDEIWAFFRRREKELQAEVRDLKARLATFQEMR